MASTTYYWDEDEDNVCCEEDENGEITASYTHEPGLYGEVIAEKRGDDVRYFNFDGEGNTSELTDQNENVTDTYEYTAFGEEVARTGTTVNPFGYKGALGYYANPETDDIYVRARTYAPTVARWSSTDPFAFIDGANLYYYVGSNPLNVADPSGFCGNPNPGTATCGGPPIGNTFVGGRGRFRAVELKEFSDDTVFEVVGSSFSTNWTWNEGAFSSACECCCCNVGFIQVKKESHYRTIFGFPTIGREDSDWEVDKSIPYPNGSGIAGTSRNPCIKGSGITGIGMSDSPNAQLRTIGGKVKLLDQKFITCVACIGGGPEGVNEDTHTVFYTGASCTYNKLLGITTYGCIRWEHRIVWNSKTQRFDYIRKLNGETVTGVTGRIYVPVTAGGAAPSEWYNAVSRDYRWTICLS